MEERASGRQLPPIEHPEHRIRIHSSDDNLPAVVEVPKYKPDAGLRRSNSSPTGNRASRLDHVPVTTPEPIEDYVDEDEDPAPLASLPPLRRSKTTPSRPDNPNSERASEASRTSPKRESLSVYGTTATDASPALMRHRTVGGEANGAISFSSHVESMLSLGARESLGKPASNNDGWMGPPYDKDGVTTRTKGRRTVCLYRPVDVLLFDRVARWKMKHKGKTKEQAWDNFAGPHMNQVDAIVKLHYGVDRYDYILKFRSSADPRPELNRKTFEKKLLMRGVIIEREQSVEDPKDYFVKVVVPFHVLCTEAQVLKLRMPQSTNEDYAARATEIGGSLTTLADRFKAWASIRDKLIYPTAVMSSRQAQPCSPFQKKKLHTFVGGDVEKNLPRDIQMNFFRDSYRSLMAHHMITGVEITIKTLTGKSDRKEGIPYLLNEGIYTALFHDHDDTVPLATRDPFLPASLSRRSFLIKEWVSKYFRAQPMEEISSYCGEKVAFYFAFFGFYNKWLVIACLFGLIVTLYGLTKYAVEDAFDWTVIFDNEMTPVFGAITSLWAVLLPYVWRRQSTFWAWRWSTMDFEKEESKRPQFKSTAVRKSPVTGKQELYFSSGKRLLRQLASVGVMFMWLGAIAISIAGQVSLGAYLSPKIRNNIAVSTITSMLGLISIFLMKIPFFKVVRQLNEWENYRTESAFEDALILKSFFFDFANSYSQLIYYSFVKPNLINKNLFGVSTLEDTCPISAPTGASGSDTCASGIMINLFVVFIGGQFIERFQELTVPWLIARWATMSAQMRLRMRRDQLRKQRLKIISPTDEEAGEKKGIIASASEDDRAQTKVALTADDTRSDAYDYVSGASMMSSSSPTLKGATLQPFSVISLTAMSADEYVMAMDENNPHTRLPQYYRDSKLLSHPGIRDEFSQKVIQFGFLAMFICSFPLAPCFALVNNVYEIRADASKTLMVYQRPVPTRAQDIGVWEQILTFIATLSVLTNSVIISFTSPAFDRMYLASAPDEGSRMAIRLTFILTFHYVIHGLKEIIRGAFSDVPKMVSLALAREQYLERLQRDQVEEEDEIMSVHSLMSLIADDENEQ